MAQLDAIHSGKPQIQNGQGEPVLLGDLPRRLGVGTRLHVVTACLEDLLDEAARRGLVLDDERASWVRGHSIHRWGGGRGTARRKKMAYPPLDHDTVRLRPPGPIRKACEGRPLEFDVTL